MKTLTSLDLSSLGREWGWILATGIAYVILSAVAFFSPVATTYSLTVLISSLLLVGGVVQAIQALRLREHRGSGTRFIFSVLSVVAGVVMLRHTGLGMVTLTMTLGFYFLMGSATQGSLAWAIRPQTGWGWMMLSSVVSLALGAYVLWSLPVSALWIPGTVFALDLLSTGISFIGFSLSLRRLGKRLSPPEKMSTTTRKAS